MGRRTGDARMNATDRQRRYDNILIGFLIAAIVTVVALAMLGAVETNDWPEEEPAVPASVYQHPEEE